jgi:hypothetical protein
MSSLVGFDHILNKNPRKLTEYQAKQENLLRKMIKKAQKLSKLASKLRKKFFASFEQMEEKIGIWFVLKESPKVRSISPLFMGGRRTYERIVLHPKLSKLGRNYKDKQTSDKKLKNKKKGKNDFQILNRKKKMCKKLIIYLKKDCNNNSSSCYENRCRSSTVIKLLLDIFRE